MTPSEFKAWFSNFVTAIDEVPTKEQFAEIKARASNMETPHENGAQPTGGRVVDWGGLYVFDRSAK